MMGIGKEKLADQAANATRGVVHYSLRLGGVCRCRTGSCFEIYVSTAPDYVTFGYLPSHFHLSCDCHLSSVTFVRPTQPTEIFSSVSMPFYSIAIR